jgi:putative peptidoglycan lipid II flippase
MQLPVVSRQGATLRPTFDLSHPVLPRIGRLMTPTLFGMAITQLNIFVDTILASLLPEGSVSYLYYADRIVEFPLGVFGIAIATAALPSMAAQAARQDLPGLKETLNFAIRLSCFAMVPASIGMLLLRAPIVRLFFERGDFGPDATIQTAWALGFFVIGLVSFAGVKIVAQAFYSLGDVRTPVRLAVATMLLNILLNLLFMRWLAHGGLALATSCSSTVNFLGLLFFFRRRAGLIGGRRLLSSVTRVCLASLSFVPVVVFCLWVWPVGVSRWVDVIWLFLTIGASVAVYLAISFSMKGDEGPALLSLLTRRGRLR